MTDLTQTLLHTPWGCAILAVLAFQAFRLFRAGFDLVAFVARLVKPYVVPVWPIKPLVWLIIKAWIFGGILYAFNTPLIDSIQGFEYWYNAVPAVHGYSEGSIEIYENQIKKNVTPAQFEILKTRTAEMAAKINSTPLAIYESALLECGLKPFRVRDDRIAAGWIQFTRSGCQGLGVSLEQVIAACERKDINFIMDLTERYLVRKWEQAGRPDMRNTIDLYLAIFAPAHIGGDADKTVYAGFNNPAYYKNSGLDGWYQQGGIIYHKDGAMDGRITIWEIYLCLEYKKAKLLKN